MWQHAPKTQVFFFFCGKMGMLDYCCKIQNYSWELYEVFLLECSVHMVLTLAKYTISGLVPHLWNPSHGDSMWFDVNPWSHFLVLITFHVIFFLLPTIDGNKSCFWNIVVHFRHLEGPPPTPHPPNFDHKDLRNVLQVYKFHHKKIKIITNTTSQVWRCAILGDWLMLFMCINSKRMHTFKKCACI
jgi:hypothetical protein